MTIAIEDLYRQLHRIRRVEQRLADVYPTDKIQSPMHLSIGQELCSVAVCSHLLQQDRLFGTYRGHALYLARGGNLRAFVAELYGKATGCTKGKGGSMHLAAPVVGLIGCSAIVGSTIPLAVGSAWAQKMDHAALKPETWDGYPAKRSPNITVVFFGDGATEEGVFYESLNIARLHDLPVLFVCENNGYAIHSPAASRQARSVIDRAAGVIGTSHVFSISTRLGYERVLKAAEMAVRRVRHDPYGTAPFFLEIQCARYQEHVGPGEDFDAGYRTRDEIKEFVAADPITTLRGELDPAAVERIDAAIEAEIDDAFRFADESPFPAPSEVTTDVYG